ncbi:hypothetical protein [Oceanobacillus profundus]|uniref:Lipoprotein n=1 Tax=Oceanobacillus profundus TaxID=372463 RepID=A0A417YAI6_9BACI|nr:hypothetical protein [Oceanobacillus profundus]MCM3397941.1 hypothetical protein [Oceanobacillus profundus]RHW29527.1 hypothetical protein D1B32_21900 [Oceanobacillus profundus]
MKKVLFSLVPLLFILFACQDQQLETNYYLSLLGDSETWRLSGYEIILTPDEIKVGNGKLIMKEENKYITDSFSFDTYAVINGVDHKIHAGSVSGRADIKEQTTGTLEGGAPIDFDELSSVYMIIEWWDPNESDNVQERINLYQKPKNDETFLNEESL